jgi:hypothetical protein
MGHTTFSNVISCSPVGITEVSEEHTTSIIMFEEKMKEAAGKKRAVK